MTIQFQLTPNFFLFILYVVCQEEKHTTFGIFKSCKAVVAMEHQYCDRNVLVIGISDLDIIWNLGIGIWDFRSVFTEANYFHLSRLESTLTLPWGHWFYP